MVSRAMEGPAAAQFLALIPLTTHEILQMLNAVGVYKPSAECRY